MGFPRQEHQSGLPFPSPDPGIEPKSPAWAGGFFTTKPSGKCLYWLLCFISLRKQFWLLSHLWYPWVQFFFFFFFLEYNSYKLNPMNCSLPGSSVHGIFQARVLEWVVISFSRQTTQPMKTIFSIPDLKTVKKTTNQIIIKTKTSFTSCHHFPPIQ